MPLRFSSLCTLLSDLESYANHDPPWLKAQIEDKSKKRIKNWFTSYRISSASTDVDLVALLSVIYPDRRKDRVYGLKSRKLAWRLKRVLCLGSTRWPLLDQWQKPGYGGLADCVERVLRQAEHAKLPIHREVTLEHVDLILTAIAQRCRFSSPKIRDAPRDSRDDNELLGSVYLRLQSNEAKWLTRIILAERPPMFIPEGFVFAIIDHQLPQALRIHENFEAALDALRQGPLITAPSSDLQNTSAAVPPRPIIGVKVGRPEFLKARSIRHAIQLARGRTMCIERKYDGEYCQVHVDIERGDKWIQIFSKSGKDSTCDRFKLHEDVRKTLRIGQDDCTISRKCILEGEMVVWDDETHDVLEFGKIRKHISRSGVHLGARADSPAHVHEHLMIFFYDVLMIDDEPILERPLFERRVYLERLIRPIMGRVGVADSWNLDFSKPNAAEELCGHMANAFARRWEGLVMKPADESYFGNGSSGAWIKLKKDYIPGLGDTADIAVIGASYDQSAHKQTAISNLKWTHFYLGCLFNRDEVMKGAKPYFAVIDMVSYGLRPDDLKTLNQIGVFSAIDANSPFAQATYKYHMVSTLPKMAVVFKKPFVLEVMGGGFDKPSDSDWYTLRWPRVLKIHEDRDWKEAVDLEQLQQLALEARTAPVDDIREEIEQWMEKLGHVNKRTIVWGPQTGEKSKYNKPPAKASVSSFKSPLDQPVPLHQLADNHNGVPRRSSKSVMTPMIRMDSNEMLPEERRTESGEVSIESRPTWNEEYLRMPTDPSSLAMDHHGRHPRKVLLPIAQTSLPHNQSQMQTCGKKLSLDITEECHARSSRKRKMSYDRPFAENHAVLLGYATKKIQIHIEDGRFESQTDKTLHRSFDKYLKDKRIPISRTPLTKDSLTSFERSFLVSKIAVGVHARKDNAAHRTIHLSSPDYQTSIAGQTSQATAQTSLTAAERPVDEETESLPTVIPETP